MTLTTGTPLFDLPTIFPDDTARTRRTDPVTSHEAGDRSAASAPSSRAFVQLMLAAGPLSQPEIITAARARGERFSDSRIRSAVSELRDAGLVEATGFFRLTDAGNRAIVWQLTKEVAA